MKNQLLTPVRGLLALATFGLLALAPALASVADSFERIKADYEQAVKAKTFDADLAKALAERCMDVAAANQAADERFGCWNLVLTLRDATRSSELDEPADRALGGLVEHCADDPRIVAVVCKHLQKDSAKRDVLLARTKTPAVKAACVYAHASGILADGGNAQLAPAQRKLAEELYDRLAASYGTVEDPRTKKPWSALAEQERFQLDHLTIGQLAPDIEGEDLDGVPFKLSDYRGKVVVLDFWGNW